MRASYRVEIKRKRKAIALLTDSKVNTLCMGVFNKFLKEGTAYLKLFPGAKLKQVNYRETPVLLEHQFNALVVHVGIKNLSNIKNGMNITQISRTIIKIAQRRGNHDIDKMFIYSVVYSAKVKHELIQILV